MAQIWWGKPVTVETAKIGQKLAIASVERAAEFMLNEWPSNVRGNAFSRAKESLLDAFEGNQTPDQAKASFIEALRESGVYIFVE